MKISGKTKRKSSVIICSLTIGILIWGFIVPSGLHAAAANNAWSLSFVKYYYNKVSSFPDLFNPPVTHSHSRLFLIKETLNQKNYDQALEYITPLVETKDPLILNTYAQILYHKEDYFTALEIWKETRNVNATVQAAIEFQQMNRQDLYLLSFGNLYEIDPERFTEPFWNALQSQGFTDEAIATLDNSIYDFPDSRNKGTWLRLLGVSYSSEKKWTEAENYFHQAWEIDNKDWRSWLGLGRLYYAQDQNNERAFDCFEKVIEIAPERVDGYHAIGLILLSQEEYSKALDIYRRGMERNPDNPEFPMHVASVLLAMNQFNDAIEILKTVIDKYPDQHSAYIQLSRAYWLNDQPDLALTWIEKGLRLRNPANYKDYLLAGNIYEKNGLHEKAVSAYKDTLRLNPDSMEAQQAIERLTDSN